MVFGIYIKRDDPPNRMGTVFTRDTVQEVHDVLNGLDGDYYRTFWVMAGDLVEHVPVKPERVFDYPQGGTEQVNGDSTATSGPADETRRATGGDSQAY